MYLLVSTFRDMPRGAAPLSRPQVGERVAVTGRREQLDMGGNASTAVGGADVDNTVRFCIHPRTVTVGAGTAIDAETVPAPPPPPLSPRLPPAAHRPPAIARATATATAASAGAGGNPAATPASAPSPAALPIPSPAAPPTPAGRKSGAGRRNGSKSHKFARFLVDTFGRERLRAGAGVVDVAGGNGDLALCLATLHRVRCTVIDPDLRPPSKQATWAAALRAGWVAQLRAAPRQTPMLRQMQHTWTVPPPSHIAGRFLGAEDPDFAQGPPPPPPGDPAGAGSAAQMAMQMQMARHVAVDDGTPATAVAALLRCNGCDIILGGPCVRISPRPCRPLLAGGW